MKKIKKGSRAVAVLLLVSIYVLSGVAFNLLPPERVDADNDNEITICHATGSPENPYNKISVNKNSIVNPGNAGHGSSGINENDIIPPFSGFDGGHNWDDEGQAIYYNDCEVPNGDTGEITIVATKIICENENDLPKWASSGAPNKIEENTATDWLDGKDGCYLAPGWGFQWRLPEFDYPGDDKIGYADGWSHFDGETDSNGVTQVTLSEDDINGSNQIAVREVLQDGYIPFTHQSSGSPPSAELYCHDDIGNYDNWEWVRNFTLGGTYYCVAFNAYKSTDVEICKQDDEGNSLEGWNITLSSEEKEWEKSDETDGDGCIIFENVPYGDYVIEEEDRDGWRNVNGLGEVNIDEESNEFLVVNERVAVIKAYKIICEEEGYLPDWVKDRNFPSPSNELTKQDIFDYADNEGCEFATEEWYFEWGYDGQAERKDGDHIGSADDPNWYSFDTSAIGESPAVVIIENLDPSNKIWVRELLKDGYIPFTDHPGNSGTSESAELICHTDGFNYDNYEYVEGMEKGNVYYCLALNVPKEDPLKDIPFYESADSCPIGTAPRYLETHEISSTEPGGKEISLEKDKTYLFRALGTYSFRKQEPLWHADAGYSTKDGWGNTLPDYGIRGEDPNYAAHALLGDLGEDTGIGVIDWGDYNTDHEYEFYYEIASDDITFLIGDRYGDWFETDWQEQVGMDDNEGSLTLEIHECVPSVTIYAYKIVCKDESYLPNRAGGADITSETAAEFVSDNEGDCWFEEDWDFEWVYDKDYNAEDGVDRMPGDYYGYIEGEWNSFDYKTQGEDPAVLTITDLEDSRIWVREVLQGGYIPFSDYDGTGPSESAEFYCHKDVEKYDNREWIDVETGEHYHCVAFNAPEIVDPVCEDIIVVSNEENDVHEVEYPNRLLSKIGKAIKTFVHNAWATISGAEWIWKAAEVENPEEDEVYGFRKEFDIYGTVSSATLKMAADNSYKVWINGEEISDRFNIEDNYSSVREYDLSDFEYFEDEGNVIEFKVKNWAQPGGTSESNPAGLLYKLTIERDTCYVPEMATIKAHKIICDDESYLPEWGDGGEDITEDTVGNFLEGKEDYCRIETDWYFQWAPSGTDNPGDNEGEIIDENWKTFSSQTVINLDNLETSTIWVREVFQDGYIPFTHDSTKEPPSAQLYCHIDVLNYDNYDRVDNMTDGGTYYCVAFNAPITDNDSSDNNIVDGNDSTDPSVGGTASSMGGQSLIAMGGSPGETITFPQIEIAQAVEEEEEEECGMYLLEFIRFGADNNPNEVRKLQMFLNEYMGENLPVTGFYDLATFQAVERFQVEHKEEVLRPWVEEGIHDDENSPTGYVFETTRRWINMLVCPELGLGMPNLAQYALTLEAGEEEIVEEEEEVEDIEEVIAPLEEEEEETEEITQVGDAGFLAATLGQFMTPEARQFLLVVLSLALLGYLGMLGYQKFLKKRK